MFVLPDSRDSREGTMPPRPCPRAFAICPKNVKMTPGTCKLLFETPSGFAIFSFDMQYLHKDIEDTWHYFVGDYWHYSILALHAFRKFEDKSNAINITTRELGGRLARLLSDYCLSDELLVVGRPEYKSIIEEKLRQPCFCDEIVMEVMWGLQNLMPLLIPQEESEFTKVDRLPICKGLDMLLCRHGINNVKQELINEDILLMALKVYHADVRENEHSIFLWRRLHKDLKASGFDVENWDVLKLATAVKSMVDPDGTRLRRAEYKMFSDEEHALMDRDAPKYEDLIDMTAISKIYDDIVAVRAYVVKVLLKLRHLLKKAEAALETEDALERAATNGVDSMRQVDNTSLAVGRVVVPNQSSIAEEQQRHTTSGTDGEECLPDPPDSTLPTSQKNNEPSTSVEGTNQENEAEKASLGEQTNTILDVVLKEPAQETSGAVTSIEEVIATNKDTLAVGTTPDVAQHANTQAQEVDAAQIINALVKNRGMHTNNGEGGEQADEDITGGGEQGEVTDLSKSSEITEKMETVAVEGGKQAEITVLRRPTEMEPMGVLELLAESSRTGLHAGQSEDKKISTKVASPVKPVDITGGGEQGEVTGLSKSSEITEKMETVAGEGGKQAETTVLRRPTEMEPMGVFELHAESSRTGLHAGQSEDKKISTKVASPVKLVDITGGGEQGEVTDLSKSLEITEKMEIVAGEGGKQAEITVLRWPTEMEPMGVLELNAESSRTGLHAGQSKDKKISTKVASPVKPVSAKTKQGKWGEGTSLLSLLSIESPEQTQTRRRSESMTRDMSESMTGDMSESHAQDFRRDSKAVTSRSGPLTQPSRLQFMHAGNPNKELVNSSDPFPVYEPRSSDPPPPPYTEEER